MLKLLTPDFDSNKHSQECKPHNITLRYEAIAAMKKIKIK